MPTPEEQARETIDQLLEAAGWRVQNRNGLNLGAARGVAVREFPLETGFADYLLFVDRQAVGVVEAKPAGHDPERRGRAIRRATSAGLPADIPHVASCPCPSPTRAPASRPSSATSATPSRAAAGCLPSTSPETLAEWAARARDPARPPAADCRRWITAGAVGRADRGHPATWSSPLPRTGPAR